MAQGKSAQVADGRFFHSGQRDAAAEHFAEKPRLLGEGAIFVRLGIVGVGQSRTDGHHALWIESHPLVEQVPETPQEQASGNEQHQGEGELGHHQDTARARLCRGTCRAAGLLLERVRQVHAPTVQCGSQTEDRAGGERGSEGEEEDAGVDRDVIEAWQALGQHLEQEALGPEENGQAGDGAEQREEHALRQQLTDEPCPGGSQRLADGHLAPSRAGARQEEVRNVQAPDEQDQSHRTQQQHQRLVHVADHGVLEGHQSHRPPVRPRVIAGELAVQGGHQRVQALLRLRDGEPGCEARDGRRKVPPVPRRVIEQGRAVEAGGGPDLDVPVPGRSPRGVEVRRHHADDVVQVRVELDTSAHDVRIAGEGPLPHAIADDDLRGESRPVIPGIEGAAQPRLHPDHMEVVRRHDQQAHALGLRRAAQIVVVVPRRRDVFEDPRALEVLPLGLGHSHVPRAHSRKIVPDADQLLGPWIGQRMQEGGVHDAEDRGGRSDAHGHGRDHDGGDARRLAQHAQGAAEVVPELVPPAPTRGFVEALAGLCHVAEGPQGRGSRLFVAEPSLLEPFRLQLDVGFYLGPEVTQRPLAPPHGSQVSSGPRTRPIAAASLFHLVVSLRSCFRPAAVRE